MGIIIIWSGPTIRIVSVCVRACVRACVCVCMCATTRHVALCSALLNLSWLYRRTRHWELSQWAIIKYCTGLEVTFSVNVNIAINAVS